VIESTVLWTNLIINFLAMVFAAIGPLLYYLTFRVLQKDTNDYIRTELIRLQTENTKLRDGLYQAQMEIIKSKDQYVQLQSLYNELELNLKAANEEILGLQHANSSNL